MGVSAQTPGCLSFSRTTMPHGRDREFSRDRDFGRSRDLGRIRRSISRSRSRSRSRDRSRSGGGGRDRYLSRSQSRSCSRERRRRRRSRSHSRSASLTHRYEIVQIENEIINGASSKLSFSIILFFAGLVRSSALTLTHVHIFS